MATQVLFGERVTMQAGIFGDEMVMLPRVGSTNDVAKEMAVDGAPEGTVVVADEQTAGRGRLGRRWLAPPGTCLLCSILFRPQLSPDQANRLTMLCAMAAADAIEQVSGLTMALKWPNDLVVESYDARSWRKLAGILTETGMTGKQLDFVVVGIGLNVNVPPDALPDLDPNATSILAQIGHEVSRASLLAALLEHIEARYERFRSGESPRDEWAERLATLGQRVKVVTGDDVLTGVADSVDENGALLLRTDDGERRRLLVGDVTLA
jgi:BirA family biotin operon repressor/biotin-[acetyl-CoA-carboxylase] ligase